MAYFVINLLFKYIASFIHNLTHSNIELKVHTASSTSAPQSHFTWVGMNTARIYEYFANFRILVHRLTLSVYTTNFVTWDPIRSFYSKYLVSPLAHLVLFKRGAWRLVKLLKRTTITLMGSQQESLREWIIHCTAYHTA